MYRRRLMPNPSPTLVQQNHWSANLTLLPTLALPHKAMDFPPHGIVIPPRGCAEPHNPRRGLSGFTLLL
jgi:hypothetical protein